MDSILMIQEVADDTRRKLKRAEDYKDDWRQAKELKCCECDNCTCGKRVYLMWPELGGNKRD